ncbi:hypothetical protein LYNGBM3L_38650 [Moorena producens 3L]|uniref:Uncharacterized protein n=1 Tax=Moorena producens 3L TaxID=489825 RepID=F4XVG3_9CYAN|nr:hypothetical protein LYNGBM3L_38650 [Moorena producens 3L]OLT68683.1 hypothetical protein BI334_30025 [Moorena producens 3L]
MDLVLELVADLAQEILGCLDLLSTFYSLWSKPIHNPFDATPLFGFSYNFLYRIGGVEEWIGQTSGHCWIGFNKLIGYASLSTIRKLCPDALPQREQSSIAQGELCSIP